MRKLFYIPIGLTLLILGSCALFQDNASLDQDMARACSGYNAAGTVAVTFYDQMDTTQLRIVDSAVAIVGPICTGWGEGTLVLSTDLVSAINIALIDMLAVTGSFDQ